LAYYCRFQRDIQILGMSLHFEI